MYRIELFNCEKGGRFMYKLSEFTKPMYKIGEVKQLLGVTTQTLHNYDRDGILKFERTQGGHRVITKKELVRYLKDRGLLEDDLQIEKWDVIYARVDTQAEAKEGILDMKALKVIEGFNGTIRKPKIFKEVGSSIKDNRKQLNLLLDMVLKDEVKGIYTESKDTITTVGYKYIEKICKYKGVKIHTLQ
jgi:predicted site-specific integrase-resolvase